MDRKSFFKYKFKYKKNQKHKEVIPNKKFIHDTKGVCLVLGHKIHHHQIIVILQNENNKSFCVPITRFEREFKEIQ